MKYLKYIFAWVGVLLIFAFVGGYAYVRLEGKALIEKQLSKFFGQPTEIEEVRYLLPAGVRIKNLTVRNIIEAKDVRIYLRVPFLLRSQVLIARLELIDPVFQLVRHTRNRINFGGIYLKEQEKKVDSRARASDQNAVQGMRIDFLSVEGGRFEILDLTLAEPDQYLFDEIRFKTVRVDYPFVNQNIKFDLQGRIEKAGKDFIWKGARVSAGGWINWPGRAIDAQVSVKGVSGVSTKAELKGKENQMNVTASTSLGSADISENAAAQRKNPQGKLDIAVDMIQSVKTQFDLTFNFQTKMDEWTVKVLKFDGNLNFTDPERPQKGLIPAIFSLGEGFAGTPGDSTARN